LLEPPDWLEVGDGGAEVVTVIVRVLGPEDAPEPPELPSDAVAAVGDVGRAASTRTGELARLSSVVVPSEPTNTPNASIANTPAAAARGVGIVTAGSH